jgi:hypothetical protein
LPAVGTISASEPLQLDTVPTPRFALRGDAWVLERGRRCVEVNADRMTVTQPALIQHPAHLAKRHPETSAATFRWLDPVLSGSAARATHRKTGEMAIERSALVTEEIAAHRQGVEQRWRVLGAPSGDQDLLIRIGVEAARRLGLTRWSLKRKLRRPPPRA